MVARPDWCCPKIGLRPNSLAPGKRRLAIAMQMAKKRRMRITEHKMLATTGIGNKRTKAHQKLMLR